MIVWLQSGCIDNWLSFMTICIILLYWLQFVTFGSFLAISRKKKENKRWESWIPLTTWVICLTTGWKNCSKIRSNSTYGCNDLKWNSSTNCGYKSRITFIRCCSWIQSLQIQAHSITSQRIQTKKKVRFESYIRDGFWH